MAGKPVYMLNEGLIAVRVLLKMLLKIKFPEEYTEIARGAAYVDTRLISVLFSSTGDTLLNVLPHTTFPVPPKRSRELSMVWNELFAIRTFVEFHMRTLDNGKPDVKEVNHPEIRGETTGGTLTE